MSRVAFRLATLVAFAAFASGPAGALYSERACRDLGQSFMQIERGASTVEINVKLFTAADKGCVDVAKTLLEHGASVDARDLDGSTALLKAAENGRLPIVRLLVERGADVNLPGRTAITPIGAAAFMGSAPIVQFLLDKGADPNAIDATKKSAIVYAAGRGFTPVVRLLLDRGVDVNTKYGNDLTVLMWAAGYSAEAGVKDAIAVTTLLIERGAKLDERDNRGRTALMIAAELNHAATADLLIARGADKSLKDKQGKTAGDLTTLTALREKLAHAP